MWRVFASQLLITSHHAEPIRPGPRPILLQANRFPSGEYKQQKPPLDGLHYINMGSLTKSVQSITFLLWIMIYNRVGFCLWVQIYPSQDIGKIPECFVMSRLGWERMWDRLNDSDLWYKQEMASIRLTRGAGRWIISLWFSSERLVGWQNPGNQTNVPTR